MASRLALPAASTVHRGERGPAVAVAGFALVVIGAELALDAWRRSLWPADFGAPYALTARLLVHGPGLYRDVAAAQPPPLFWSGAVALAVHDAVISLRVLLGAVSAITAGLVGLATWRLTRQPVIAGLAGLASIFAPWSLNQHDVLAPEPFVAVALLGAAVCVPRRRLGAAAGVLGGLAVAFKVVYLLPAALLALVAARVRAYVLALVLTVVALGVAFLALYGRPFVDGVFVAQAQSGLHTPREIAQLLAQGGWNLVPLLALAALGALLGAYSGDPPLARALAVLLVGEVISFASLAKNGTYLNTLAVAEPAAVALGAAGLWLAFNPRRSPAGALRWGGRLRALVALATLLVVLESASLIVKPSDAVVFLRPFSRPAHGPSLSPDATRAAVAAARRCPRTAPYSGPPSIAFLARRSMPGDQPDLFIVNSPVEADARAKISAAARRCP